MYARWSPRFNKWRENGTAARDAPPQKGGVSMRQPVVIAVMLALSLGGIAMADTAVLTAAKKAKKDEFYTQRVDIENELRHYRAHFAGKVVLFPLVRGRSTTNLINKMSLQ